MNIKSPAFIGSLGLIALILGLTGWYMSTHPAPVPYSPQVTPPTLGTDVPKKISEKGTYYTIDVTYPTQISFPLSSRSDAGATADRTIKAWVDQNIAQFKSYVGENEAAIQDFISQGEEVPASLSSMQLTVVYERKETPRTVTYLLNAASYIGGAHGMETPTTFTFDATTGTRLALADLFLPQADYLTRLSTLARSKLPGLTGDFTNDDFIQDGTRPIQENFQVFYLEGDDLVFLFPPYQVAPYAAGTIIFRLDRTELNDILKPEFRVQ
ncbi:MAG: DUF3298 domain-containing protein [Patescibacteria group bacterium]